jgi:hypothetical protein
LGYIYRLTQEKKTGRKMAGEKRREVNGGKKKARELWREN